MRHSFLLLILLTFNTIVQAQSLEECRELAKKNYPEIKQYDLISKTEQFNLSNAVRSWIPQVAFSAQFTYQSETITYPDVLANMLTSNGIDNVGIKKDQYKIALDVNQNIWDGGQTKANKEIIASEAEEQRLSIDVDIYNLQSRIDNLYFGILLLDEREKQTIETMRLLEGNLEKVRSYYNNGIAMQADLDAVEAEILTLNQSLEQILASKATYRKMLEIFIGQELTSDTLQRPSVPQVSERVSMRPELSLFDSKINKINAQMKMINTSVYPRFNAFAQAYYGYPGFDMFKSMTSTDLTINAIVGLKMSWNISAFYTKKNNIQNLEIIRQQIDVQRDIFNFNTEMQICQDDGEIARLTKALENDKRIIELRRSVREASESLLENGIINTTDLLQKITEEATSVRNQTLHEIELLQAIYRLKHTLNQ